MVAYGSWEGEGGYTGAGGSGRGSPAAGGDQGYQGRIENNPNLTYEEKQPLILDRNIEKKNALFNNKTKANGTDLKSKNGVITNPLAVATTKNITTQLSPAIDAMNTQARGSALKGAAAQQYDHLDIGWDTPFDKIGSFFTGETKNKEAAEEEQKYGEFSQVQFNTAINDVANPLANRSSLPPEVASDIALNPRSKRSSIGEKAMAWGQAAIPIPFVGTAIGAMRAGAYSKGYGGKQTTSPVNTGEGAPSEAFKPAAIKRTALPTTPNSTSLAISPAPRKKSTMSAGNVYRRDNTFYV